MKNAMFIGLDSKIADSIDIIILTISVLIAHIMSTYRRVQSRHCTDGLIDKKY